MAKQKRKTCKENIENIYLERTIVIIVFSLRKKRFSLGCKKKIESNRVKCQNDACLTSFVDNWCLGYFFRKPLVWMLLSSQLPRRSCADRLRSTRASPTEMSSGSILFFQCPKSIRLAIASDFQAYFCIMLNMGNYRVGG